MFNDQTFCFLVPCHRIRPFLAFFFNWTAYAFHVRVFSGHTNIGLSLIAISQATLFACHITINDDDHQQTREPCVNQLTIQQQERTRTVPCPRASMRRKSNGGEWLFNVYLSNCLSRFAGVDERFSNRWVRIFPTMDVWLWSSSHATTRSQVYIGSNVEEKAIEVINCKLIWIPAGNKKQEKRKQSSGVLFR